MPVNNGYYKLIKGQLDQDLIGKDAFRGVSQSYTWLANQFGHFALGFIPVIILHACIRYWLQGTFWACLPVFLVWFGWFRFEVFNFSTSLSKDELVFYRLKKGHFLNDLWTDLGYFGLGAASAFIILLPHIATVLLWGVIFSLLIKESRYWYLSKIYLQRALYPFQFRLSQWTRPLSDDTKKKIEQFMNPESPNLHLLVFGEDDDEKLLLCVGIGSEISYQLVKCRYLTTMKVFECFYRKEPEDNKESHLYNWNWHEARFLIIDDVNPSHKDMAEVITTEEFLQKIEHKDSVENKKQLCEKKVIWMLGNETTGNNEQQDWEGLLDKIGIHAQNIITINLSEKKQEVASTD
jgi:hypothetical protein